MIHLMISLTDTFDDTLMISLKAFFVTNIVTEITFDKSGLMKKIKARLITWKAPLKKPFPRHARDRHGCVSLTLQSLTK